MAVVLLWALAPGLAQAYIDPGNGAYMVQALFTLMGAAAFYIGHPIRTLIAFKDKILSLRKVSSGSSKTLNLNEANDIHEPE